MTFTLLHISDLHRAESDPIGNAELLSTLLADGERARREHPAIGAPDAIIVTGDLVQGVRLGHPDPETELSAQWQVAGAFLARLADELLEGDRSRLVVVPGNHDVDWNEARAAMQPVADDDLPDNFSPAMCGPLNDLRWNWRERRAYRIVDRATYAARLARFGALIDTFYDGVDIVRTPLYRMHSLLDERIVVVAFDSCVGNDCFAAHGAIAEEALAQAHMDLRRAPYELHVAAWHHSIHGEPGASDYMSVSTVDRLIGKGFRLGLHGHQHRAAAANRYVHLPEQEMMAVVSAGSLCAGARGLPVGVNRQYNLIELDDELTTARVHVREMAIATNFAPARRAELGFQSHIDLEWTLPADLQERRREHETELTMQAERANAEGRFDVAEGILRRLSTGPGSYARSLLVIALREQNAWRRLADALQEPDSIAELVEGAQALTQAGAFDEAERYVEAHCGRTGLPGATAVELENMITAGRSVA
jgi:3',5'-cyclic AMP phosphodiesterase CpdA